MFDGPATLFGTVLDEIVEGVRARFADDTFARQASFEVNQDKTRCCLVFVVDALRAQGCTEHIVVDADGVQSLDIAFTVTNEIQCRDSGVLVLLEFTCQTDDACSDIGGFRHQCDVSPHVEGDEIVENLQERIFELKAGVSKQLHQQRVRLG